MSAGAGRGWCGRRASGLCHQAPAVEVGHNFLHRADAAAVQAGGRRGTTPTRTSPTTSTTTATSPRGGYQLLERVRSGALSADEVLTALDGGGLRGLGGAGFPTGRKWRSVRGEPGPRLMAVNGDEGEPGTFKDGHYLNTDPHRFLEGTLIGATVVEAADDLPLHARRIPDLDRDPEARDRQAAAGPAAPASAPRRGRLYLRRGKLDAGEHRGQARAAAAEAALPVPGRAVGPADADQQCRDAVLGARHRRDAAPEWWKSHGRHGRVGLRSYSVSGRVQASPASSWRRRGSRCRS